MESFTLTRARLRALGLILVVPVLALMFVLAGAVATYGAEPDPATMALSARLSVGTQGHEVASVQRLLVAYGYAVDVSGSYGPETEAAVRRYQSDNGLVVDGWVGAQTSRALGIHWVPSRSATGRPSASRTSRGGTVWDRLAQCESGQRWSYNGGSGYDGGLQFLPSTWRAYGGGRYAPYAWQASRAQQIDIAERVLADVGWRAWPTCSRRLGLR